MITAARMESHAPASVASVRSLRNCRVGNPQIFQYEKNTTLRKRLRMPLLPSSWYYNATLCKDTIVTSGAFCRNQST